MAVGGGGRVRLFDRRMAVGGGWCVRRPPRPLRPARCRCRVRGGAGRGCGRPARGERAAKTRRNLSAEKREDFFAFLLHFAACRAETLLRDDDRPMRGLMVDRYGERRALTSRFLSPEPLSCMVGGKTGTFGLRFLSVISATRHWLRKSLPRFPQSAPSI